MKQALLSSIGLFALSSLAACTDESHALEHYFRAPVTSTFHEPLGEPPPLGAAVERHTATLLADGTVLLAGGIEVASDDALADMPGIPGASRQSAWLYVSSEVGITPLPDLVTARSGHTATRLLDGTVLLAGGFDASGSALDSTELYTPGAPAFVTGPSMPGTHGDGTATLLADGRVLLVGGYEDSEHARPSTGIELFDPTTRTFTTVANPRHQSGSNLAVSLVNGAVVIRWTDFGDAPAELFEAETNQLSLPNPPLFSELVGGKVVAATRLEDGALVVFDGASFQLTDRAGVCAGSRGVCEGRCISLTTADNCGACGRACPTGMGCNGDGTCGCNPGGTWCDGECRDIYSDLEHCGGCGRACRAGEVCASGECAAACGDQTLCDGRCVWTTFDRENCGTCGHGCGQGEGWECSGGTCYCDNGVACGTTCTSLGNDPEHCGSCENRCASNEACVGGVCMLNSCLPLGSCGSECRSFDDPQNCGGCDITCSDNQACVYRQCVECSQATVPCGTTCSNLFNDPLNCGACGHTCDSGTCTDGFCEPTCPNGEVRCGGTCTNVENNQLNCGACYEICQAEFSCVAGRCTLAGAEDGTASRLSPVLSGGRVWTTAASSALSFVQLYFADESVAYLSGSTKPLAEETFGGSAHTTTALPDGSLLVVGGHDTPHALRLYPEWSSEDYGGSDPTQVTTLLLPDGQLLVVLHDGLFHYDGKVSLHRFRSVPPGAPVLGAALQPSGTVLLPLHTGKQALLFDPSADTLTSLELAFDLASTVDGRAMALRDGAILIAGRDGVEVLELGRGGKTVEVDSLPLDLGCDRPSLTRLANGRILVVGKDRLYELDPASREAVTAADLASPRCHATPIQRRDGTILIIGGFDDESGAPSAFAELYDPSKASTKRWSVNSSLLPVDTRAHHWFDEPLLIGGNTGAALLDWQSNVVGDAGMSFAAETKGSAHLTAGGWWLYLDGHGARVVTKRGLTPGVAAFDFPTAPSLRMGDAVDFEATFPGHPYPGSAPEGSTGTTQSSPANLPIPVWFPAEDGWPSVGTLTTEAGKATYRVPSTPFPGLGLLFLSTNGDLTPLGPVTIAAAENGAECRTGGECDTGFCVDGVCCDHACDGTCEACSRAKKGGGKDGECEPVAAGTPDDACQDNLRDCGENGTCDAEGQCARYPDGSPCARGAACTGGQCIGVPTPPSDSGSAGDAGAPNDVGTGGTRSNSGTPHNTCNADEQIVSPDGTTFECAPYRCRNATCLLRCESTRDCASGHACDPNGRCVTPVARPTEAIGCGCRVPRRSSSSDWGLVGLVAAAACLTRRGVRRAKRRW